MPSLLHVLEVDKYATMQKKQPQQHQHDQKEDTLEDIMSADYGGMNWGVIAVYTCPSCCSSSSSSSSRMIREDFLVVQASIDEVPCKKRMVMAPESSNNTPMIHQENALDNDDGDFWDDGNGEDENDDDDNDDETVNEEFTMDW
jgi:Programmed cell death protein 2, C-terminal putative domain